MIKMGDCSRREFLGRSQKAGLGLAAGMTILSDAGSARATPANDKIVMAIVGVRGRGSVLAPDFAAQKDCEIAYVCDVDSRLFGPMSKKIAAAQNGREPKCVQDFRKALDDKSVDAMIIATPDHWHVPAAIWSCQAGKDVYVEKPLSHNCWEGRKMVEVARSTGRVVQVGMQNRSAPYNMAAKKYIADGKLGRIHFCRIFNQKEWPNFSMSPRSNAPAGFDWDMWNGPAPPDRYSQTFVNKWNHFWRYSGGDMINDGIHQIDLARWVLGLDYPTSVCTSGGRFDSSGAAETPDTQTTTWQFPNMIVNFELTLYTPYMLKIAPVIRQSEDQYPYWPQCATRIEIYGSEGLMYLGRHGGGWQVYSRPKLHEGVLVAQKKGKFPDPEHKENFVECIRTRQHPNADVEEGHRSALWGHYANISYRLGGERLSIDAKTEHIVDNPPAMQFFRRQSYRKPWTIGDET
jgi:predicted dehydrogenase